MTLFNALYPRKYYSFKSKPFKFDETLYAAPFQGTNYESKASICSNLAFNAFEDISVLFGPNG